MFVCKLWFFDEYAVTFEQFNAYLLKELISLITKNLTGTKLLNGNVHVKEKKKNHIFVICI